MGSRGRRSRERSLPAAIAHVGAHRFFWASDYPHSDHDGDYMAELDRLMDRLPADARPRRRGANAAAAYHLASRPSQ